MNSVEPTSRVATAATGPIDNAPPWPSKDSTIIYARFMWGLKAHVLRPTGHNCDRDAILSIAIYNTISVQYWSIAVQSIVCRASWCFFSSVAAPANIVFGKWFSIFHSNDDDLVTIVILIIVPIDLSTRNIILLV